MVETIRKLIGTLRNPRVVYKIKLIVVIILFILALVNGNIDVVLSKNGMLVDVVKLFDLLPHPFELN